MTRRQLAGVAISLALLSAALHWPELGWFGLGLVTAVWLLPTDEKIRR